MVTTKISPLGFWFRCEVFAGGGSVCGISGGIRHPPLSMAIQVHLRHDAALHTSADHSSPLFISFSGWPHCHSTCGTSPFCSGSRHNSQVHCALSLLFVARCIRRLSIRHRTMCMRCPPSRLLLPDGRCIGEQHHPPIVSNYLATLRGAFWYAGAVLECVDHRRVMANHLATGQQSPTETASGATWLNSSDVIW